MSSEPLKYNPVPLVFNPTPGQIIGCELLWSCVLSPFERRQQANLLTGNDGAFHHRPANQVGQFLPFLCVAEASRTGSCTRNNRGSVAQSVTT